MSLEEGKQEPEDTQHGTTTHRTQHHALHPVVSLVLPAVAKHTQPMPNGGLKAWLQVLGVFCMMINTFGASYAFGVFEAFYTSGYLSATAANISIIGAVQVFFLLASGFITGPLFDRGYFYHLLWAGAFLTCFGQMMTSICKEYYQVLLAQGICVGLGSGCLFTPCVAILPTYFSTRKLLASGIAATGGPFGGIIFPLMFRYLEPRIGYGWAVRAIGFVMFGTCGVMIAVLRTRMVTANGKKVFDWTVFSDLSFMMALANANASSNAAFALLLVANTGSVFGRVIPGLLADKYGPLNILAPSSVVCMVLLWTWIPNNSVGGLFAFAALYGFFSGYVKPLA
ncbi:hypothetical protein LTR10_000904 [Elasticomyces elasticus]|nr:hypothetical protein LTR10_000904 [Elasticomyces elasticus]